MKRSEINAQIDRALHLFRQCGIALPAFAHWSPAQWRDQREQIANIREIGLGWDVTDFGHGSFAETGSVLFTLRNGSVRDTGAGTPYAEKLIVQLHETQQEIPLHFHRTKTEDIINRAGGILMLELYRSLPGGALDTISDIEVHMDGMPHTLPAGAVVAVPGGCSITLTPGVYHRFWAQKGAGDLVVGEVSSINDDAADNVFYRAASRYTSILEDEPPRYLLCNEYDHLFA